jgi:hypothetical protein
VYSSVERRKKSFEKTLRAEEISKTFIHKNNLETKKNYDLDAKNYHTPERNLEKSKSRKKIFEES